MPGAMLRCAMKMVCLFQRIRGGRGSRSNAGCVKTQITASRARLRAAMDGFVKGLYVGPGQLAGGLCT